MLVFVGMGDAAAAIPPQKKVPDIPAQLLANPDKIPRLIEKGLVTKEQIPNPHWKENACTACHKKKAGASRRNLRHKSFDKVCNTCHESLSNHKYIHVSNIKVPKDMQARMPKDFRQSLLRAGNKMTCITCHDLPKTCVNTKVNEKTTNPMFFRQGPYGSRSGICYKCHDAEKYKRINAHDQLNDKGELQKKKCLICHTTNKDLEKAENIDEVEFNLKDNLSRLCWGCHKWEPHPGGSFTFFSGKGGTPNHLVKPSPYVLQRMKEKQQENDVVFPLEPGTGKVFCGTCHNPHEKGIIKNKQAAKGADSNKRLRMQEICKNCHDK